MVYSSAQGGAAMPPKIMYRGSRMELGEVGQLVSDQKQVLLVTGPCAGCGRELVS